MGSWRPVPMPGRFAAARRSRLVGRRNELLALERIWPKVEAGDGQVVLIGGEPGSGKTRLAAELAGALHDHGVTVLVGAASKDAGVPYEPFVEILDHLLEHGEPGAIAELLDGAPFDLGRLSAQAAPASATGARTTRRATFAATCSTRSRCSSGDCRRTDRSR